MTFKELIPEEVYTAIEQHLARVCLEQAASSWKRNSSFEPHISAAFFQGISTARPQKIGNWEWGIDYCSTSPLTEEPFFGADGIFHIEVDQQNTSERFRKGFIYQSKKTYNVGSDDTLEQLKDIERHVKNSSLLVVFDKAGYDAVVGKTFLKEPGLWKSNKKNLCTFFSKTFLTCNFGVNDLYYDFTSRQIMHNGAKVSLSARSTGKLKVKKRV